MNRNHGAAELASSLAATMEEERVQGGEEETILEALDYDDVEMLDAEASDAGDRDRAATPSELPGVPTGRSDSGGEDREKTTKERRKRRKKRSRNKRKGGGGTDNNSVSSINRFVLDTCRVLKEKKSYLVWNAVGCLGVAAVSDLVKEVNAIQACGGQQTADGSRPRTGGGILWNILKTRDPKAYKEIMAKGREFEKQFRFQKARKVCKEDEKLAPSSDAPADKNSSMGDVQENGVKVHPERDSGGELRSALERIRAPVAYDDLFEEGEIV